MGVLDGVLGRPNDYYKLYLITALAGNPDLDDAVTRQSRELADTLFPRVAAWYAASH